MTALLVILGGAAGAPSRWLVDQWVGARRSGPFPWGTFVINVAGSFVLGVLLGAAASGTPSHAWVALVGTGFCGAFTTFSTFGFEAVRLTEEGDGGVAGRYLGASLVVGIAAACLGWFLGTLL